MKLWQGHPPAEQFPPFIHGGTLFAFVLQQQGLFRDCQPGFQHARELKPLVSRHPSIHRGAKACRVWPIGHDNITFNRLKNVVIPLWFSGGENADSS